MSSLTAQRFADKKQLTARFHDLRFDLRLNPAQPEDGSTGALRRVTRLACALR